MIVRVKNGVCSLMHLTQFWKMFSLCRMWISFNPCFHASQIKELYEKMKLLLSWIQYNIHFWNTCGDLKVIVLLVGMQLDLPDSVVFYVNGTLVQKIVTVVWKSGTVVRNLNTVVWKSGTVVRNLNWTEGH